MQFDQVIEWISCIPNQDYSGIPTSELKDMITCQEAYQYFSRILVQNSAMSLIQEAGNSQEISPPMSSAREKSAGSNKATFESSMRDGKKLENGFCPKLKFDPEDPT